MKREREREIRASASLQEERVTSRLCNLMCNCEAELARTRVSSSTIHRLSNAIDGESTGFCEAVPSVVLSERRKVAAHLGTHRKKGTLVPNYHRMRIPSSVDRTVFTRDCENYASKRGDEDIVVSRMSLSRGPPNLPGSSPVENRPRGVSFPDRYPSLGYCNNTTSLRVPFGYQLAISLAAHGSITLCSPLPIREVARRFFETRSSLIGDVA